MAMRCNVFFFIIKFDHNVNGRWAYQMGEASLWSILCGLFKNILPFRWAISLTKYISIYFDYKNIANTKSEPNRNLFNVQWAQKKINRIVARQAKLRHCPIIPVTRVQCNAQPLTIAAVALIWATWCSHTRKHNNGQVTCPLFAQRIVNHVQIGIDFCESFPWFSMKVLPARTQNGNSCTSATK